MSKPIDARSTEHPISGAFVHDIRVGWADCDPANIAYTGRIPCWSLEAIDAWWEATTKHDWFQLNIDRNVGTPFVHMTLDFRSPITPRHRLNCEVSLIRLGESSIRHRVRGFQGGVLCFEGEFVSVAVIADEFRSCSLPEDILKLLPEVKAGV